MPVEMDEAEKKQYKLSITSILIYCRRVVTFIEIQIFSSGELLKT